MYTFHVADVCLWCHCTCMFAFYCSSHLAGSVSLADSVKSMHQLISHPTDRSSEGNSSGTDIGPTSKHIAKFGRPDIGCMSVQYNFYVGPI